MEFKGIKISCDYPGGNIKVVAVEGNRIKVEQDLRDTTEWWFYWNFCMENFSGEEITVEFMNGEVVGPWGPATSFDGVHWRWLGQDSLIGRKSFRYKPDGIHEKVWFSFSLPYLVQHFDLFYKKHMKHKLLQRDILCVSEQKRDVTVLRLGNPMANQDIVFTCRSHACESIASYVLEGILTYLLEKETPFLSPLLRQYMIHIIPFVDIDGVENGDQGKSRAPHDHNQDYTNEPIYKSTAAVMEYVRKLNLVIGIDLHSLANWGSYHDYPLFVRTLPHEDGEIKKMGGLFRQVCKDNPDPSKVVYEQIYDKFPWDPWEIEKEICKDIPGFIKNSLQPVQRNASSFFRRQGARLGFTFETPYFGKGHNIITQDSARGLGKDFAKALELYVVN